MKDIFDHKVVNVKKVGETDDGFDIAEFTFDDGDTVEAAVKFMEIPSRGENK